MIHGERYKLGCFSANASLFGTKMGHVNLPTRFQSVNEPKMPFSTGTPLSAGLFERHNELHKPVDSLQKEDDRNFILSQPEDKPLPFELSRKLPGHSLDA